MEDFFNTIWQVVLVTMIIVVTRWLFAATGNASPSIRCGISVYSVKKQWRIVGLLAGALGTVLMVSSIRELPTAGGWIGLVIFAGIALAGFWMASGVVTVTATGIRKDVLWRSRVLQWKEITEVRVHGRHGGAIEVHTADEKIVVDLRINAFQHLLEEIVAHAELQCSSEGHYVRK